MSAPIQATFLVDQVECEASAFATEGGWIGHVSLRQLANRRHFIRQLVVKGEHASLQAFVDAARAAASAALQAR